MQHNAKWIAQQIDHDEDRDLNCGHAYLRQEVGLGYGQVCEAQYACLHEDTPAPGSVLCSDNNKQQLPGLAVGVAVLGELSELAVDGLAMVAPSGLAVGVNAVGDLFGLAGNGLAVVVPSGLAVELGLAVGVDDIGELAIWACNGR